jgi:hypothetical protein
MRSGGIRSLANLYMNWIQIPVNDSTCSSCPMVQTTVYYLCISTSTVRASMFMIGSSLSKNGYYGSLMYQLEAGKMVRSNLRH